MLGEEARAAADVEHSRRRQRLHDADELLHLLRPAGSLTVGKRSGAKPRVVVLGRALVEVRMHLIVCPVLGHLGDSTHLWQ